MKVQVPRGADRLTVRVKATNTRLIYRPTGARYDGVEVWALYVPSVWDELAADTVQVEL
jgi:hypothetical protein